MIEIFELKYGSSHKSFHLDTDLHPVSMIQPRFTPPPDNPITETISNAIHHPLGNFSWDDISPASHPKVAIAINDKTRPVPHETMLPPLLNFLQSKGYASEQITFMVATGTHTPLPKEEFTKILPEQMVKKYRIISHNCDDKDNLEYIGETTSGTPVWANAIFYHADLKIVIGNIEPHHFMGFSGGNKSASIGVAGRETITKNHGMITAPNAVVGKYEDNPMRMDVEEIGDIIGVSCALNVIMNTKREIIHALFGTPRAVMQAGVPLCRSTYQTEVPQYYDLVIASVGGYPKDINFYQAQKAMTHSALLTKPGGTVILVAECREGSGSAGYEEIMAGVSNYEQALQLFLSQPFRIGPHKAYQVARLLEKINFHLVSELSPTLADKLCLQNSQNLQQIVDTAVQSLPAGTSIAVLPNAINTIPIIRE